MHTENSTIAHDKSDQPHEWNPQSGHMRISGFQRRIRHDTQYC